MSSGLPRKRLGDGTWRQAALWAASPAVKMPQSVAGQYPRGFIPWALRTMRLVGARASVLHICSGSLVGGEGIRVDIRPAAAPDVVADAAALPLRAHCVPGVLIDPPYSERYARELYGSGYPRMSVVFKEAARVVMPGGAIGILHPTVHSPPAGVTIEAIYGITTGVGFRIRAWTIYRTRHEELWEIER